MAAGEFAQSGLDNLKRLGEEGRRKGKEGRKEGRGLSCIQDSFVFSPMPGFTSHFCFDHFYIIDFHSDVAFRDRDLQSKG